MSLNKVPQINKDITMKKMMKMKQQVTTGLWSTSTDCRPHICGHCHSLPAEEEQDKRLCHFKILGLDL
jgi:hypothetical protein